MTSSKTLKEEIANDGQKKVDIRYAIAYNNKWTVDDDTQQLLLRSFPSFALGHADRLADEQHAEAQRYYEEQWHDQWYEDVLREEKQHEFRQQQMREEYGTY